MATILNFPKVQTPTLDTTSLFQPAPIQPVARVRISGTGLDEVVSQRALIPVDELYQVSEAVAPELETGLRLLADALVYLRDAIVSHDEHNVIAADDAILKLQALLPELFCCRTLGDGFGAVINAIISSIQGLQGQPLTREQILVIANVLRRVRSEPFIGFEAATEEIMKLEEKILSVDPPGFTDFISEVFDEQSIR